MISLLVSVLPARGQVTSEQESVLTALGPALKSVKANEILQQIRVLASDKFEGRNVGTVGETLTVNYLVDKFRKAGLKPGNPNGTFVQDVPMVGFLTKPRVDLTFEGREIPFSFPEDFVHDIPRLEPLVDLKNSEVLFVGYGISAPEFGWDDYKGVDVRNKVLIMLGGEPSMPDKTDPSKADSAFFKGDLRTFYGTMEFKKELAAKLGAAAVLYITDPEKSPNYSLFKTFAFLEGGALEPSGSAGGPLAFTGLIKTGSAKRLLASAGKDLVDLETSAQQRNFNPVSTNIRVNISITSKLRKFVSRNVIARIEGSDPKLKNEYVVYSAHWDHLGKDASLKGDQIYNGALDNASGTALMVEIARAFARLKIKPKRSILFIATTGEEKGYLGSRYFVESRLYPLASFIANINIDGCNVFGRTSDTASSGFGNSTLDEVLGEAAKLQGRTFQRSSIDNGGIYFASDQIEFAKVGVPAVYPWNGSDFKNKPADYIEKVWEQLGKNYHQVSDEVDPEWDLSGAVEDAQWLIIAGFLIAQADKRPEWKPGSEFKERLDRSPK